MSNKKDIVVVGSESGDWEQLYIDGKSVYGNHSITMDDILEFLNIDYSGFTVKDEWLEKNSFPEFLKDIPKKAIDK